MKSTGAYCGTIIAIALVTGCSNSGPYGYARTYMPTEPEQTASAKARPFDPLMAERRPEEWSKQPVSLYAVVSNVREGDGGNIVLLASLRRLQKRNLCRAEAEESCRVTVSEKPFGQVRIELVPRADEASGADRIEPGSLLRVIGNLAPPAAGQPPRVVATFHRHWPAQHYVTTAARKYMRR